MRTRLTLAVLLSSLAAPSAAESQEAVIQIYADHVLHPVSRHHTGVCIEDVNHEIYGGLYSQMIFGESFQEPGPEISAQWRAARRGDVMGRFAIDSRHPFTGTQSQFMTFDAGKGRWGIENQGLNRWGMSFVAGKPYQGCIWARAEKPTTLFAAMESRDGSQVYAETPLAVAGSDWQRIDFKLTPATSDRTGRFALVLKQSGSVTLGHAFLQPGEWGRFKGLPVRRDVAEALIDQGITVLRYGGSMVNCGEYRWKKMIGPRDRRPPYAGTWYRYSSNGWGILDFMAFCEAAGFQCIPDFSIDETPQDLADFIEYAKGASDSPWGRKRVADGHAASYQLKYLELGNEERVDEKYAAKFEALAEAIWAADPEIILVVGDFAYGKRIQDPVNFSGADSRITSLAGQQRILQLAKRHSREVWFDVHVNTDHLVKVNSSLDGMFSFADALDKLADGAKHKVVVFELNAGNHAQQRALANAIAINAIERDGRIPVVTSANGLQPDGQNDNGWDQGLLFLNPFQVWLQPPGYVTQMLSRNYLPQFVNCQVSGADGKLDANAKRSKDGRTLILQVVNSSEDAVAARINLNAFSIGKPAEHAFELSAPLTAANRADTPLVVIPHERTGKPPLKDGTSTYVFPAHSFTVVRFD